MNYDSGKEKILFTGHGEKMIENVIQIIGHKYEIVKCAPLETDLRWALKSSIPHVMVVCLMDETRGMLHVYDILQDEPKFGQIPVIVIGAEEECSQFQGRVMVKHLKAFPRPLDREGFQQTLHKYIELSSERMQSMMQEQDMNPETGRTMSDKKIEKQVEQMAVQSIVSEEKKCVLVVDDDVRMLNTIKLYLQDLYDVTVVPSGKLALKFVSKKQVDLVLLDYVMPEMDGPQVLKEIRENSPSPDVPVIFLTGVSDKDEVMRGLEFRPNGYLLKPVARETLIERVTEAILGL